MPLSPEQTYQQVQLLLSGSLSLLDAQDALRALSPDDLSAEAIAKGAMAMLEKSVTFPHFPHAIDVCGTGGDGTHSLNISTATAFVVAASGTPVAKHGNRSVSSKSGSSDVLQALGISLTPSHTQLIHALSHTGLAFLFAPDFHPALGALREARKSIHTRSIFNLLGPLTNPARPKQQLIGVYDESLLEKMLEASRLLGCEHCMVVHGGDGGDECAISTHSQAVYFTQGGSIKHLTITPEDAGLSRHPESAIKGGDAKENAAALSALLQGETGAYHDAVCLNAACAFLLTGQARSLLEGAYIAQHILAEKKAWHLLTRYQEATKSGNDDE